MIEEEYQPTEEDLQNFNDFFPEYTLSPSKERYKLYTICFNGRTVNLTRAAYLELLIYHASLQYDHLSNLGLIERLFQVDRFGLTVEQALHVIDPTISDIECSYLLEGKTYPYITRILYRVLGDECLQQKQRVVQKCQHDYLLPYDVFYYEKEMLTNELIDTESVLIQLTEPEHRPLYCLRDKILQKGNYLGYWNILDDEMPEINGEQFCWMLGEELFAINFRAHSQFRLTMTSSVVEKSLLSVAVSWHGVHLIELYFNVKLTEQRERNKRFKSAFIIRRHRQKTKRICQKSK